MEILRNRIAKCCQYSDLLQTISARMKFTVFNNHESLQYYKNVKTLSSLLNRLALKLVEYDFKIKISRYRLWKCLTVSVGIRRMNRLSSYIRTVNMEKWQSENEYLFHIRQALLISWCKLIKHGLKFDGYIWCKTTYCIKSSSYMMKLKLLLVVPRSLVLDIQQAYHDSLTVGRHSRVAQFCLKYVQNITGLPWRQILENTWEIATDVRWWKT